MFTTMTATTTVTTKGNKHLMVLGRKKYVAVTFFISNELVLCLQRITKDYKENWYKFYRVLNQCPSWKSWRNYCWPRFLSVIVDIATKIEKFSDRHLVFPIHDAGLLEQDVVRQHKQAPTGRWLFPFLTKIIS
tara:strand:+ start:274 stop:672 length:399 start_codon:yes stop_codon:yes gene_type:complete